MFNHLVNIKSCRVLCTAGRPSKCHTGAQQGQLEEIDREELRRKVRERLKRAEKVRRRGEEGERVRRRRDGGANLGQLAIVGDVLKSREECGGRVNLGLKVDEMELREEIVRRREKRAGEEESDGNVGGQRLVGGPAVNLRARQTSSAPNQLDNLGLSILGEEGGRRGSTSSPIQLATIHEPDEEQGREREPEVVIRVTDLCE